MTALVFLLAISRQPSTGAEARMGSIHSAEPAAYNVTTSWSDQCASTCSAGCQLSSFSLASASCLTRQLFNLACLHLSWMWCHRDSVAFVILCHFQGKGRGWENCQFAFRMLFQRMFNKCLELFRSGVSFLMGFGRKGSALTFCHHLLLLSSAQDSWCDEAERIFQSLCNSFSHCGYITVNSTLIHTFCPAFSSVSGKKES